MSNFKDHDNEAVGFESKWKETRSYQNSDSQTEPIKTKDEATQPVVSSTKEAQTGTTTSSQLVPLSEDEEQSLAKFLSNISTNVMKELDKNDVSNAMAQLVSLDFDDVEDIQSEKVQSFEAPKIENTKIKVSCVSWNCTGSLLAVSFCSEEHDTWCSHDGIINFYNTEKSIPSRSIKTKSCVTSICMHPYEVSLVAAGMYSGEVCTYNLHLENVDCVLKSTQTQTLPVTQISWEYTINTSNRPHLVVSCLDGTLSLYNILLETSTMNLVRKYVISDPALSVRPGVLCFSFSPLLSGTFITSVEGGQLYSCSTLVAVESDTSLTSQEHTYNPIVSSFDKHPSNVRCLSFSKHTSSKENQFVSCSLEEIRIYNLSSSTPVHTIFCKNYCLGLLWSITQPQVLFYWGNDHSVVVYNVSRREQIMSLDMNKPGNNITVLGVNAKMPNLIATGNSTGETHVWQIPKYFKL